MKRGTKTKGLPYQSVQFQSMASSMRLYMEDLTLSKSDKIFAIYVQRDKLIKAANENAEFWIAQCEDGEFCKKD